MIKKLLALIGPGFITASLVLGPGSMTVATKVGASFGYDLLWWLGVLWVCMCGYTCMSARVGVLAGRSVMALVAERFGRWAAAGLGLSVFIICCSFQAGDVIGVSAALAALVPVPDPVFKIGFPLLCIGIYYGAPNVYRLVERLMLAMVLLMIASFFINLFQAHPSAAGIVAGLRPKAIRPEHLGLMTAMSATNFVVAAAFYQSYLVREKGWTTDQYRRAIRDTLAGITLLFVLVGVIQVTSAAVLRPRGIEVQTAADMAIQLEPLMGAFAKYVFCAGLFAASFSSLLVNALTGATLLADGLGKDCHMTAPWVKNCATGIMLFGLTVSLWVGGKPVGAIILLQKLTLLTTPFLAGALIWAYNRPEVAGGLKRRLRYNTIAGIGLALILYLFVNLLRSFAA